MDFPVLEHVVKVLPLVNAPRKQVEEPSIAGFPGQVDRGTELF